MSDSSASAVPFRSSTGWTVGPGLLVQAAALDRWILPVCPASKDAFGSLYLPRPGPRDTVFVCLDAWTGYGAWPSACKTLPRAWLPGNENGVRFLAARLARDASEHAAARKIGSPDAGGRRRHARGKLGLPPPLSRHSSALYPHPRLPSPPFSSAHSPSASPL
jgi:hypothetical protein